MGQQGCVLRWAGDGLEAATCGVACREQQLSNWVEVVWSGRNTECGGTGGHAMRTPDEAAGGERCVVFCCCFPVVKTQVTALAQAGAAVQLHDSTTCGSLASRRSSSHHKQ